jgi:hypothetical protein
MSPLPPSLPRADWHPVAPVLSDREILALLERAGGAERYSAWLTAHHCRIRQQDWNKSQPLASEPYHFHFELPHWLEARYAAGLVPRSEVTRREIARLWKEAPFVQTFATALRACVCDPTVWERLPAEFQTYLLILLGGNRAAKSEICAFLTVESALQIPECTIVCGAESLPSSRATQQALIYKYLPKAVKMLNGKHDPKGVYKVKYSVAGGFTEELLVLPNGSAIHFRTWNQAPADIEGWFLGSKRGRAVGFWADEDAPSEWIRVGKRRCNYSGSLALWSFTPINGMTPAIKEYVSEALTLIDRPAELLDPTRIHVPGCRPGTMPYLQQSRATNTLVLYFFSQFNPFGTERETTDETTGARVKISESFYEGVKREVAGSNSKKIQAWTYGYTEDVAGRKFKGYSAVNVVKVENLPSTGTLYQFTDPHGSRPYASLWVLVAPGNELYFVREFPDEPRFGEWAVPTKRATSEDTRKGWDGDPGPAQRPLGWGVAEYKKEWLDLERVRVPGEIAQWLAAHPELERPGSNEELVRSRTRYPWHRSLILNAADAGPDLDNIRESIYARHMDARFCNTTYAGNQGTTCLKWEFEKEQKRADGTVLSAPMFITPASGKDLEHGFALVTDLLSWDREQPFIPHVNAPRIFVSEECTQLRWMFENYTGLAGEAGACKEWADLVRHAAEAELQYIRPGVVQVRGGGWGY